MPLTEKALTLIGWVVMAFSGNYALAQITPDQTLGNESSVVTPNSIIRAEPGDLIEGGAARGSNLFHSFQDFNVGQLQRVYFANPAGIDNILSRVTGSNISNILGTLGVDGGANLFLLNPNGIVFGQNARLDIAGSFFASTANSLVFNNGTEFSATNPQAPPLLSITITPGLQYGLNHPKPTKITNAGYLVVGQDLTLAAGQLDLQGQLIAGGDLTLNAEDTVQIRDSIGQPFIAAAGGKLLIQGNQGVDIFALNHPDSGLFSGGDLVLRTQNTVAGDAHYWSGGSFRIEQLDGSLGDLFSPDDPIIRSVGDVSFNSYLGTSLHIVAGGAVDIGFVIITGNETGTQGIDFISEAITLSNGTVVDINGQAEPTLDIRAGVDPNEVGIPGLTGNQFLRDFFIDFDTPIIPNFFDIPTITNTATSADIKIGTIAFANVNIFDLLSQNISPNDLLAGKVLLTNQYKPNPSLAGDIEVSATLGSLVPTLENVAIQNGELSKGGSVTIDSRGSITLNGIVNTIAIPSNDPFNPFSGNGGDVTFLANDNITLKPGSLIVSAGIVGGKITTESGSNFLLDDAGVLSATTGAGVGGNLIVNASESVTLINREGLAFSNFVKLLNELSNSDNEFTNSEPLQLILQEVLNGSGLATITTGPGDAGNLTINTGTLSIQNQAQNQESENSQAGATTAMTRDFTPNTGATTATTRDSTGNSGDLTVYAESVEIVGNETGPFIPTPNEELASAIREIFTGLTTATEGTGKGGDLTINTQRLTLKDGAGVAAGTVATSLEKAGAGGKLTINATESVTLSGKATLATGTLNSGDAGKLEVNTPTLTLRDGGVIAADTTGSGNAGALTINTGKLLVSDGSRIGAATGNTGTGAEITIMASEVELVGTAVDDENTVVPSGIFANSQFINNERNELGDAGSINIDTKTLIVRDGAVVSSSTEGAGAGGTITITTPDLTLQDEGQISASTSGTGTSGSIVVENADSVELANNSSISTEVRAGAKVNPSPGQEVGTIDIKTRSLTLTNDSEITSSTAGDGDAGNITLRAEEVTIEGDSQVSATTSRVTDTDRGKGGNINIIEANRFEAIDGGNVRTTTEGTEQAGNITLEVRDDITLAGAGSGLFANTTLGSSGNGGNIFVDPRTVTIRDGAKIAVDSQGTGEGGNIELQAGRLTLDNQAELSAETASNQGGNITLTIDELLFLRRNSQISTTAGTAQAGGNGGNITINAPFILGIREEDSDITANAFEGNGGNINITTQGIIGLEFRENVTPLSDITASSEFGLDGTVNINAPEIDPSRGLSELPTDIIDVSQLIEKNLCAGGEGSEFIATGRGGLPISPNETLNPNATWDDWRITEQPQTRSRRRRSRSRQHQLQTNQPNTNNPKPKQIIEAQGWVIGANGEVILTAHPVIVTPKGTWLHQVDCPMLHQTFKRLP